MDNSDLFQIFKITGIGKAVNIDESIIRIDIFHIVDEVRTNEAATTGYQDSFFHKLLPPLKKIHDAGFMIQKTMPKMSEIA